MLSPGTGREKRRRRRRQSLAWLLRFSIRTKNRADSHDRKDDDDGDDLELLLRLSFQRRSPLFFSGPST